jgi:hypothetical protein
MIRFAWQQSRNQTLIGYVLLAAVAVAAIVTGLQLSHLYNSLVAHCESSCALATQQYLSHQSFMDKTRYPRAGARTARPILRLRRSRASTSPAPTAWSGPKASHRWPSPARVALATPTRRSVQLTVTCGTTHATVGSNYEARPA